MKNYRFVRSIPDLPALRREFSPLFVKFRGETSPQPAFLSLDGRTRDVDITWTTTRRPYNHGKIRYFSLPVLVSGGTLADFLEDEAVQCAIREILDGLEEGDEYSVLCAATDLDNRISSIVPDLKSAHVEDWAYEYLDRPLTKAAAQELAADMAAEAVREKVVLFGGDLVEVLEAVWGGGYGA